MCLCVEVRGVGVNGGWSVQMMCRVSKDACSCVVFIMRTCVLTSMSFVFSYVRQVNVF